MPEFATLIENVFVNFLGSGIKDFSLNHKVNTLSKKLALDADLNIVQFGEGAISADNFKKYLEEYHIIEKIFEYYLDKNPEKSAKKDFIDQKTDDYSILYSEGQISIDEKNGIRDFNNKVYNEIKALFSDLTPTEEMYITNLIKDISDNVDIVISGLDIVVKNQDRAHQKIDEINENIEKIIENSSVNKSHLIECYKAPKIYFLGRDDELDEIDNKLTDNKLVFLRGVGGIGKSELAKAYSQRQRGKRYKTVIHTSYQGSIKETLVSQVAIANLQPSGESIEERYQSWLIWGRQLLTDDVLLIVDNVDEKISDFSPLTGLNCDIVITTRLNQTEDERREVVVKALASKRDLATLFKECADIKSPSEIETEAINQIVDMFEGHTMMVALAGLQCKKARAGVEKYKARLVEGLSNLAFQIAHEHNDARQEADLIGHLKVLFDLSSVSNLEIELLKMLSMFPIGGMNTSWMVQQLKFTDDEIIAINRLVNSGWAMEENDRLQVHSLVREILFVEHCDYNDNTYILAYINCLVETLDKQQENAELDNSYFGLLLIALCQGLFRLRGISNIYVHLFKLNKFLRLYGLYDFQRQLNEQIINEIDRHILKRKQINIDSVRSNINEHNIKTLLYALQSMANSLTFKREYERALNYYTWSLQIVNLIPDNDLDRATLYNSIAQVNYKMDRFIEAESNYNSANLLFKKNGEKLAFELGICSICLVNHRLGKYDNVIEKIERALDYLKVNGSKLDYYNALMVSGLIKMEQSDFNNKYIDEAIIQLEMAHNFFYSVYGKLSIKTVKCDLLLIRAKTYKKCYREALNRLEELRDIRDIYDAIDVEITKDIYYNETVLMYLIGESNIDQSYQDSKKVLAISQKVYRNNALALAKSYELVAYFALQKDMYEDADKCARKALHIYRDAFPNELHLSLVNTYLMMSKIALNTCAINNSKKYLDKALLIRKHYFTNDHHLVKSLQRVMRSFNV